MGRFRGETIERTDTFSHRIVDVAETIERKGRYRFQKEN